MAKIANYQVASYDGEKLHTLFGKEGVFLEAADGSMAKLTGGLTATLAASYVPAGYVLRQRIGDLEDAIREGNYTASMEILDLLRAKLGIKD